MAATDFEAAFTALRPLLEVCPERLAVQKDTPGEFSVVGRVPSPFPQHKGNPMWFGAVTFDTRVGLSHTTGEITHHIDPDIDRERNKLVDDLRQASQLKNFYWIDGFQAKREGKNGGGDPFHTDGRLAVGVLDGTHDNQGLRVDSTRP